MSERTKFFHYWEVLWSAGAGVPKKAFSNPKFVFSFLVIMAISSAGVWAPWAFNINLSSVCYESVDHNKVNSMANKPLKPEDNKKQLTDKKIDQNESTESNEEKKSTSLEESVLSTACKYVKEKPIVLFQGFAIFMFNLGLLGGIAFDFFINQGPKKYEDLNFDEEKINNLRLNEFAGFFVWVIAFIFSFYGLKEPTTTSYFSILGSFLAISLWICCNFNKAEFKQFRPDPANIEAGGKSEGVNQPELPGGGLE